MILSLTSSFTEYFITAVFLIISMCRINQFFVKIGFRNRVRIGRMIMHAIMFTANLVYIGSILIYAKVFGMKNLWAQYVVIFV